MGKTKVQWDFTHGRFVVATDSDAFAIENVARVSRRVPVAFHCEHQGGLVEGECFGWDENARAGGLVMPFSGSVVAASLSIEVPERGRGVTCQLAKNSVGQGPPYQLAVATGGGRVSSVYDFDESLSFAAGDEISFISTSCSPTAVVTATGVVLVVFEQAPTRG